MNRFRAQDDQHQDPLTSIPENADPYVNEHGETFEPAGILDIDDDDERSRVWRRREDKFEESIARLFRDIEHPESPDGVFLALGYSNKQYALTVLAAHGLARHNWASVCLDDQNFELGAIRNKDVAFFKGRLVRDVDARSRVYRMIGLDGLKFDWEIDLQNRICRTEGINFFGTIANRLGKEFRRYPSELSGRRASRRFEELLQTCDAALAVCLEMEQRLADKGMQVRITGWEQDYPPSGVFKVYCAERGYRFGIEFVEILQGYQKYFRGGRSGLVSAVDCQNVTRHKLCSASTLRGDLFDNWYRRNAAKPDIARHGREWARMNRSEQEEIAPEGKSVLEMAKKHRESGGTVACLYGSVPYDFGHPWLDTGPAHYDRKDWYNHTVATLANTETLLIIKPHPDEARSDQIGVPTEFFTEMLEQELPPNAVVLEHRWLNNADLIPLLDFGIVWRGSVAPELSLLGIPVIASNPRSMAEQVLDLTLPKDRNDYEDLLKNPFRLKCNEDLRERASMFFEFYRTQVMIPYPFGWISQKRKFAGPPVWSDAALNDYMANGHPSIDEMCKRIISAKLNQD